MDTAFHPPTPLPPSSKKNPFDDALERLRRKDAVDATSSSEVARGYGYEYEDDDPDAPPASGRKRTRLKLEAADKSAAYWKAHKHLSDKDWCAKHLKIITKGGKLVPFIFNPAQVLLAIEIREQLKELGWVRLVILKARQLGMSLVVQALMWREVLENSNEKGVVMADEKESADKVFERTRIFRDETKPMYPFKFSNRTEIVFEPPHRSSLRVLAATKKGKGRGGTYHKLHLSEVAFWPEAKKNLAAILGGLADELGTWCIWESTANGIGGEFHDKYWTSKHAQEESKKWSEKYTGYRVIFLPWFIDPDYRIPGARLDRIHADPEVLEDEDALRAQGCDDEQLAYRRVTIDGKYNGDVELWRQEMPATDREAFIASGRMVFPRRKVNEELQNLVNRDLKKKPDTYAIDPNGYEEWLLRGRKNPFEFRVPIADRRGKLTIYRMPDIGRKYLLAADVAGGKEPDNEDAKRGGDYSVAHVYDRATGEQVAVFRARLDPDLYGCVLDILGRFYNNALLAPETNNHGIAVIKCLQRLRYTNLYLRGQVDQAKLCPNPTSDMYGWLTTGPSKVVAIGALIRYFRTGVMKLRHANTLKEMATFIHHKDGSMAASSTNFDDEVIAAAIAAALLEHNAIVQEEPPQPAVLQNTPAWFMAKIQERDKPSEMPAVV